MASLRTTDQSVLSHVCPFRPWYKIDCYSLLRHFFSYDFSWSDVRQQPKNAFKENLYYLIFNNFFRFPPLFRRLDALLAKWISWKRMLEIDLFCREKGRSSYEDPLSYWMSGAFHRRLNRKERFRSIQVYAGVLRNLVTISIYFFSAQIYQ